jgi:exonuclease III
MENQINFVTFNCLSPNLSSPKEFVNYLTSDLEGSTRLPRIEKLIKRWIQENRIILLQEISLSWRGIFEKLFLENNYHFFCANYGSNFSGNMGIAIAVPKNLFIIEKIEYKRIGELIKKVNYSSTTDELIDGASNFFYKHGKKLPFFDNLFSEGERDYSPTTITELASQRQNQAIYLRLKTLPTNGENEEEIRTAKTLAVVNYHMPCCFRQPDIQLLHSHYLLGYLAEFANSGESVIIGGDFNIKPTSYIYDFITEKKIPVSLLEYVPHYFNTDERRYTSAYLTKNGEEADFTNWSRTKWGGDFKDTLDYFFVSDKVKVREATMGLTSFGKCPNSDCPSDHLPLLISIEV